MTTLSYQSTIKLARAKGYNITLLFFWLNDVNLAIERVKTRVVEGGHNIPEEVIIRRYKKGIKNLLQNFVNLCDYWLVIDNSTRTNKLIAEGKGTLETTVYNLETWSNIKKSANEN